MVKEKLLIADEDMPKIIDIIGNAFKLDNKNSIYPILNWQYFLKLGRFLFQKRTVPISKSFLRPNINIQANHNSPLKNSLQSTHKLILIINILQMNKNSLRK